MNVKYRIEFTDDFGVDWKVHIKEEGEFSITDYQAAGTPLTFDGYGEDDPFDQPIMGSKASITIWNPEEFKLLDLFSAEILQYQVVIYQNNNLFWKGYVLPAVYQEAYNQVPLEATIAATDGLGLLKEFQFSDLGYGFERQRFSVVIFDILELVGISGFTEYINIYSSNMDDGVGDSPLDQVGFDPNLFKTDNCYKVLTELLGMFNAGIKQENGQMVIYRFEEIKETMYGRKFTSGTNHSAVTFEPDQFVNRKDQPSAIRDVEGGSITMIPQASKHIINYDLGLKPSALRNWDFQFNDFVLDGAWTIAGWDTDGEVPFDTDNTVKIEPLSLVLSGEDRGVYLSSDGEIGNQHIKQAISNVKTRSPQFKLSFEYKFHNTYSDTESRGVNALVFYDPDVGGDYRYWDPLNKEWTTNYINGVIKFFDGDVFTGFSDWTTVDVAINGVPANCTLYVLLYAVNDSTDRVKIAYRDVRVTMTPLVGAEDTGIGYTYTNGIQGKAIERDRMLGDGLTVARHAVNQLLSYAGIINFFNGDPDPLTSGGNVWSTRGNAEEKTIHEVINDQMGRQYARPRQLIDLPVWGGFVSGIGNMQDSLNKVGGNNRMFHINVRSFNAKTRDYELVLTEMI